LARGRRRRGQGWFAVQFGLFLALLAAPFLQHVDAPLLVCLLGLVLVAGGIVGAVAGYRALGSSHSPRTTPIDDGRLVTTGIYAWIRHPIYAGWCLGALGGELLVGSILGVGVAQALVVFCDRRSREEDRFLADRYPDYAAYKRRAKRFIPGVY
jgi:protein-S-isoprenylcysteine O-methyltransferase Ste14